MSWPQHRVDTLTHFWHEGLSASEIGRKMRVTRNTVIGKAHRIGLPARCERWRGSREWTDAETALLVAHWRTREPVKALAKRLRRSVIACWSHAHVLVLAPKPRSKRIRAAPAPRGSEG